MVSIAAFQPKVGESAADLNGKIPPASTSIAPVGGGFLQVKPDAFPEDFAADVPRALTQFMAISQVTISAEAFGAKATARSFNVPTPLLSSMRRRFGRSMRFTNRRICIIASTGRRGRLDSPAATSHNLRVQPTCAAGHLTG